LQGEEADGVQVMSESKGSIVVGSKGSQQEINLSGKGDSKEAEPADRHSKEDIKFESENASRSDDAYFVSVLRRLHGSVPQGSTRSHGNKGTNQRGNKLLDMGGCKRMELKERDVAKLTKSSVTHVAFMPTEEDIILAAADKRGNLGLWRVNYEHGDHDSLATKVVVDDARIHLAQSTESNSAAHDDDSLETNTTTNKDSFDGVLAFVPHTQYISGLAWSNSGSIGSSALYTSAYDGSVRRLDVERECFSLAWGDLEMEYSAMALSNGGDTLLLGDNLGQLDRIDVRSSSRIGKTLALQNRKINTVHCDPLAEHLVATSSTDSTIAIWDLRKMQSARSSPTPVATAQHGKTCQSAYFCPDGSQRVLSTSFDNSIRIWDAKKGMEQITFIKHDNQTGRWVLPLRAVWATAGDACIVGSMKRTVDVIDAQTGTMACQLHSEYMTAIAARNCVHPRLPIVASATASGRIHVFRSR
jgi:WD40 repeat protein